MLFLNPKSGGGKAARAGLATLVEEAVTRGADALGVAGGDGSLAVVACVPAGTRNHFALDLASSSTAATLISTTTQPAMDAGLLMRR